MEDALREFDVQLMSLIRVVLILIVMEDALRENSRWQCRDIDGSLNPYCNGRCS